MGEQGRGARASVGKTMSSLETSSSARSKNEEARPSHERKAAASSFKGSKALSRAVLRSSRRRRVCSARV